MNLNELIPQWLSCLPLTHDMEEAQLQNQFLATSLIQAPEVMLGEGNSRMEQIVVILGEICQKKQSSAETLEKLSVIVADFSQNPATAEVFKNLCEAKLSEDGKSRLSEIYNKCNEEVRQKVKASLTA